MAPELGVVLDPGSSPGAWRRVREQAERAVDAGAASVWLPEAGDPVPVLAALSQLVDVRLGMAGVAVGRRPLTVLAKELAGLDVISHGRLEVAVGGGPGSSADPADVAEVLDVLGGLMAGGPFDYSGRLASARGARCLPPSTQRPHPPLWIAGSSQALVELAAARADGWLAAGDYGDSDRLAVLTRHFDAACGRAGRDPADVRRGVLTPAPWDRLTAETERWAESGVSLVLVAPGR
ncbi:MAG TPA: LLM class flavin-dependent oxidoreductase [Acidimicrobiales bacterium]|nr:LLM class flavin-dependent oxidoreductase [Acidimicrobiales bacterium]